MVRITLNINDDLNREMLVAAAKVQIEKGVAVSVTDFIRSAIKHEIANTSHTINAKPVSQVKPRTTIPKAAKAAPAQSKRPRTYFSEEMKKEILKRDKSGQSATEISKATSIKYNTVSAFLRRTKKQK